MRFLYLADPLFLACVQAYAVNRFLLRPNLDLRFLHHYFNDLICIPFWVPIMLFFQKLLRLRRDDAPPQTGEILIPLILWSFAFEVWLPRTEVLRGKAIADPIDIVCYSLGALGAAWFWRFWYRGAVPVTSSP
jgi:hypothetical protein